MWTRAGRSILWSWVGLHCLGSTELCTIPAMVSGSPHRWWWNVCWNDVEVVACPAMLSTSHSGARTYAMHHFRGGGGAFVSPLKNVDPSPPCKIYTGCSRFLFVCFRFHNLSFFISGFGKFCFVTQIYFLIISSCISTSPF